MFISLKTGVRIHYIIKGNRNGYPLLFLHGNGEDLHTFDFYENQLDDYKLIMVDSRCHGESTCGTLSYDLMAQDMFELIYELKLDRFGIVGFSDGAIIAILLGLKLKQIDKLFLIGPNLNPSGLRDECLEQLKQISNIYANLCLNEPNISPKILKDIDARALIIGGEYDLIKQEHLKLIKDSLNNSYLYIIKGADHFIPMNNKVELIKIIKNEMLVDCLYEDNQLIVLDKPSGILSQADDSNEVDLLSLAKEYLKVKYDKPGNVYLGLISRLDRNVSGLMVLSKTTKATTRLNSERPKKNYYAVVYGSALKNGTIISKISKNEKTKTAYLDNINGKEAILHYKKINETNGLSLLDVEIETGRFHQIRFQLSSTGHPIYNDQKYGGNNEGGFEIGLDAYKVTFIHPVTKEKIILERFPKRAIFKSLRG